MPESILFTDKVFLKRWKSSEPLRGVELFNLLLIRDLVDRNHPVTLVAEKSWAEPARGILGDRMPECVWLPNLSATFINGMYGAIRLLTRRFDVLIVGNVGDGMIPAVRMMRMERLFRRGILIAHREASPRFVRAFRSMRGHILAVNHVIAGPLRRAGHPSVHVDYGILNADRFHPDRQAKEPGELVDICVLGVLDNPWKGADTAVAAFRSLPDHIRERSRLHLASYARPPRYSDSDIHAYDWMPADRVPDFLRKMDILLAPSRDEGVMRETFSQAVVQGMLSELPVLHSDLPILKEKFDQGGGIEFKTREDLVEALKTIIADGAMRQSLGRQARHIALERYVWNTDRFIDRYIRGGATSVCEDGAAVSCEIGPYKGWIASSCDTPEIRDWLSALPERLASEGRSLTKGHDRVAVVPMVGRGADERAAVKIFGPQSYLKNRIDAAQGSKAQRSFRAGLFLKKKGVGTPEPVACLDRWEHGRLRESYYVTRYESGMSNFRDELIRIYRHEPECEILMRLLQGVAGAVAALHRAGLAHRDMGNQNILLRRTADGKWGDVRFVDLNRARIRDALTLRERAFDMSRISLPSDFLRVFKAMYFVDRPPPAAFEKWEQFYRRLFAFHTWSRAFRHPIRTRQRRKQEDPRIRYPHMKDIWIWDERSAQAISVMRRRDRRKQYSKINALRIAWSSASALPPVYKRYRALLETAWRTPVDMAQKVGVAVHPSSGTWDRERKWLERLGRIPVIVRFYHHQAEPDWEYSLHCVRELHEGGYPVAVALVQDRRAVREPQRWDAFVQYVLDEVSGRVEWVEAGHAINRVKWGLWNIEEYARLLKPLAPYAQEGGLRFMGPAVIDFEYHYLAAVLKSLGDRFRFQALSHHLYVDRRGPPEARQSGFSTLEKCALARALADWAPSCESRLIISEVNWPILGTREYSPVGSPYVVPGPRTNDPSVSEDHYADYMIRYLMMALASGMAERVYWWRLAAHGFGLIDDAVSETWRPRPAFQALRQYLEILGDSTFIAKIPLGEGVSAFRFRRRDGEEVVLAYAYPENAALRPEFSFDRAIDITGREMDDEQDVIRLTGRPVYFRGARGLA